MKRRIYAAVLGLVMLFSLTACGAAKSEAAMDMEAPGMTTNGASREESVKVESEFFDSSMNYGGDIYYEEPSAPSEDKAETGAGSLGPAEQKLIRTAWMEMETTEFDEASKGLARLTEDFGGYYETSTLTNRNSGSRWASYVIRIPAEEYTAFLNQMGELCHVTRQESNQEDISEAYYDTAGRLKTQQIKLERLQNLLAKAEFMEDIITIESAISETEWQIDNLSGTLRHYDSKVDYATVNVTLHEVYKLSNVDTVPATFGERLGDAFGDGVKDFVDGLEDLAVGFAYSWMWWLLVVVIAVLAIRAVRRRVVKKRALKQQKAEQSGGEE
ncbi:MAG: DUF4349 domain-containing protein [Ruminococcaceae bacterium]|nr:DUF4349 domain-containing protein [Oscillospiraceae bacterium]